mmetsp:Transcript_12712/g.51243  ORF Transcript_12712/g.51243 Transcript_12712/m.51243 type:complete len:82 (-) Transcript_12712:4-249(-)
MAETMSAASFDLPLPAPPTKKTRHEGPLPPAAPLHARAKASHASRAMGEEGPSGQLVAVLWYSGDTAAPRPPNDRSRIHVG